MQINYRLQHEFASRGYDGETCWVHPRAGILPAAEGANPTVVLTLNKLQLSGSDTFYAINSARSDDLGKTWTPPQVQEDFHRVRVTDDNEAPDASKNLVEKIVCDFTPQWHAPSRTLLGIGQTAYYSDNVVMPARPRQTAYSVYDADTHTWKPWRTLQNPGGDKFYNAAAGSVQRVDLPNGEVLLPIYFQLGERRYGSTVMRCSFDGQEMKYLEHGTELQHRVGAGLFEPSLTQFQGRYFLTLRNDLCGYVATSDDGLHFDEPRVWRFDDGEEVGSYNTQQHWVTHSDALFLVYTRRGLNNDHVFRHRGPLVMAQVDTEKLRIIRATERIIVPERGARIGNFGITQVSENETWVTVAEWMQNAGVNARIMMEKLGLHHPGDEWVPRKTQNYGPECESFGSDNSVWVARLLWNEPNLNANE